MKIITRLLLIIFLFVYTIGTVSAQKKFPAYVNYIEKYGDLAVEHMNKHKIPASITLAQGILESGAGLSSLAKESNNHFGIKCHSTWKGERVYKKDDGPNDCFRKYNKVEDSYQDHSLFLTGNTRYSRLFELEIKDYKGWARGLQQCGYATDKAYANSLIKLIEDYELYRYDSKSGKNVKDLLKKDDKKKISNVPLKKNRNVYKQYGLIFVEAEANDSYDAIAYDMGFKVKDLLKYNEVPEDFPLTKGDRVYLEKKKKKADKSYYEHVVKVGESMHTISQQYGIRLSNLYKMNKKDWDYVPEEGDVLSLR